MLRGRVSAIAGMSLAVFIVAMHWSNIVNMLNGSEYKFQRIRIVNWFR